MCLWLKLGNIHVIFPNFQNQVYCEKHLMDNKQNSLHLVQEYSQKLSVPRISQFSSSYVLLENCFFSEQIMSVDKCSSTLNRVQYQSGKCTFQLETENVFVILRTIPRLDQ